MTHAIPTPKQQLETDLTAYSAAATASLASRGKKPGSEASWVAFGAASSVALLASSGVEAGIVYSGPQNITLTSSANTFIDFDGGGNDFEIYVSGGGSSGRVVGQGAGNIVAATANGGYAQRFSSGQQIGTPGSSLGPVATNPFIDRTAAGFTSNTGFIGVQLTSGNFGWIQFHFGSGGNPSTVFDWAYDDTGNHIVAGATGTTVPEPSSMGLMALGLMSIGAVGLRELRRRKRKASEKSTDSAATA